MRRVVGGVLIVLLLAAGASGIARYAYSLGVAQGIASVGTQSGGAPSPAVPFGAYPGYPYGWGWPGPVGFGFFGLLWPILLIVLVVAFLRSRRMDRRWGPEREAPRWLEEWHRRAHETTGTGGTA